MLTKEDYVAGLMIDANHSLHFYIDGQKVETVTEDIPRLCHAVFSLSDLLNLKVKIKLRVTLISVGNFTGNIYLSVPIKSIF